MVIWQELLEGLLKDYNSPEGLPGQSGLLQELTKARVDKALDGGVDTSLGLFQTFAIEGRQRS